MGEHYAGLSIRQKWHRRTRFRHAAEAHALRTASRRRVLQETFDPLRQQAVLSEVSSKDGWAFVDFLKGLEPQAAIARLGCAWQAWS